MNFTSPETRAIVLPDAENCTIVSFIHLDTIQELTDRQTASIWRATRTRGKNCCLGLYESKFAHAVLHKTTPHKPSCLSNATYDVLAADLTATTISQIDIESRLQHNFYFCNSVIEIAVDYQHHSDYRIMICCIKIGFKMPIQKAKIRTKFEQT